LEQTSSNFNNFSETRFQGKHCWFYVLCFMILWLCQQFAMENPPIFHGKIISSRPVGYVPLYLQSDQRMPTFKERPAMDFTEFSKRFFHWKNGSIPMKIAFLCVLNGMKLHKSIPAMTWGEQKVPQIGKHLLLSW